MILISKDQLFVRFIVTKPRAVEEVVVNKINNFLKYLPGSSRVLPAID